MGVKLGLARALSAVSTWGLKSVFRRPAANFPGKIALYADPQLLADLRPHMREGSICVVGTNGKTTVTNMLANALEAAGKKVICNRTGANLDSGVATALLQSSESDWGVFECDELWLSKILPFLQSDYVLLLDLFRDQLDRVGEIDYIQDSIVKTLKASPKTVLVYNADDPLCQSIADRVENGKLAFGINEDLKLPQNAIADAQMCQRCESMLEYEYRQYGQLGKYTCPTCGFGRAKLNYYATNATIGATSLSFTVHAGAAEQAINAPFTGTYMIYNLLAVCAGGVLVGLPLKTVQKTIDAYDPQNGRLQEYELDGRKVLLNLAKNPTGFNQNLSIVMQGSGPKAVAFFVNDKEGDGRDVSWLWDIDFDMLASLPDLTVFAGGMRRNDLQVCLKYAGLNAVLVDGAQDTLDKIATLAPDSRAYLIANYTALPPVKAELDKLAAEQGSSSQTAIAENDKTGNSDSADERASGSCGEPTAESQPTALVANPEIADGDAEAEHGSSVVTEQKPFVIGHLFPQLLNLYGDGGNVKVLASRVERRGIPVRIVNIDETSDIDFSQVDIMFLGGGPDREQHLASRALMQMADALRDYIEADGVMLAICGGFQIIGNEWLLGDEAVPGLGLVDITTKRADGNARNRLVGDIALKSPLASLPVLGYENHAGRTFIGEGMQPFGQVIGNNGKGNNDSDKVDGVLYKNLVGTYLHGPLLAKNPEVADELIERALERRAVIDSAEKPELATLDDDAERAANAFMCNRLKVAIG